MANSIIARAVLGGMGAEDSHWTIPIVACACSGVGGGQAGVVDERTNDCLGGDLDGGEDDVRGGAARAAMQWQCT